MGGYFIKIIDLTHLIQANMPVFPGTEPPIFTPANTLDADGFLETKLTIYSHTGTHIDAPAHMLADGLTLDNIGIENYIGQAVLADLTPALSELITIEHLAPLQRLIAKADFLLLHTGWAKHWGTEQYFRQYPVITPETAEWLGQFKLKGLGVDTISVDQFDSTSFPVHHKLFATGLLVIENLTNLHLINTPSCLFSCLPLKTKNADGAPVRAVAIL